MHSRIPAIFCVLVLAGVMAAFAADAKMEAAKKSAESWLALVDAGRYAESWEETASMFKDKVTKQKWVTLSRQVRQPLGKVKSRELMNSQHLTELPGAPDGDYVVIQYKTSFENKKSAVETVTPMLDKDGKWHVSGYFIR